MTAGEEWLPSQGIQLWSFDSLSKGWAWELREGEFDRFAVGQPERDRYVRFLLTASYTPSRNTEILIVGQVPG